MHVNTASRKWPTGQVQLAQSGSAVAWFVHSRFGTGFALSDAAKKVGPGNNAPINTAIETT